jgi:hypothetical protein
MAEERRNAYIRVSASVSRIPHIASDVAETVENNEGSIGSAPPHLIGSNRAAQKQCADKNLGTQFRQRGNSLYLAVLIGRVFCTFLPIVDDLLCYDKAH